MSPFFVSRVLQKVLHEAEDVEKEKIMGRCHLPFFAWRRIRVLSPRRAASSTLR